MHFLSPEIENIQIPFATLFSNTVWLNAQVPVIGSVLCTGKRTVTSALRIMGLSNEKKLLITTGRSTEQSGIAYMRLKYYFPCLLLW